MKIYILILMFVPLYITAKIDKQIADKQVNEFVVKFFDDLKNKRTEKIARMIVEETGYYLDEDTKEKTKNDYRTKLDSIFIEPPNGRYGDFYEYNLINTSYLPGSNKYIRLYYISYHLGTPLTWEFRFYIRPKGDLSLNHISWNEKNPFDCFSSPDLIWEELKTNNELLDQILKTSR